MLRAFARAFSPPLDPIHSYEGLTLKTSASLSFDSRNVALIRSRATAVNTSRGTVNCSTFDVIVFAELLAHGIWQVSCDQKLANEWARCSGKNASYIRKIDVILIQKERK